MDVSPRIAEQVDRLPPLLKQLLDAEIALGNEIYSMELGRGPDKGKVALILNHPFRSKPDAAPPGVLYREFLDRDPRIYEFYLPDNDQFILMTAKFKPMKFEKIVGPPNPNEAHIEFMKKRQAEEEEKARQRAAAIEAENQRMLEAASKPPPKPKPARTGRRMPAEPVVPKHLSPAGQKFISSMTMTYDMWHDGLGYDLDALKQIPENERDGIEAMLLARANEDWRIIEALAQFNTPRAQQAVKDALRSSNPEIRREARHHVPDDVPKEDRTKMLLKTLQSDDIYEGLSEGLDEAAKFHPPKVIDLLLKGCLHRPGNVATHFSALLYYIHAKSKTPFDWDHRPFFLRFNTDDREARKAVFKELCETIGVDVKKYLR